MEDEILDKFEAAYPHLKEEITELKLAYTNRLYHQLSELLLKIIKDNAVIKNGHELVGLYENFVKKVERYIDQLKLIKFVSVTADYILNPNDQIAFIEKMQKSIEQQQQLAEPQAILICQLKKSEYLLKLNQWEQSEEILIKVKNEMTKLDFVDSLLHSNLYKVSYQFHKLKENYDEFYMNALQFLAYTNKDDIPDRMKLDLSIEMAIAILISPKIYNFSELLQQPVLGQLNNEAEHQWLFKLLQIFNEGNLEAYDQLKFNQLNKIQKLDLLYKNQSMLDEKIKIMSLLDLIFKLPKNNRSVTFDAIAHRCKLSFNDVEILIMRCMSLELIRGYIDQINSTVNVTWIIPRVLDNQRIQVIADKFELWQGSIKKLIDFIQKPN